jgi:hypothetical protein
MEVGPRGLELRPLTARGVIGRAIRLYAWNARAAWLIVVPILLVVGVAFTLINLALLPPDSFVHGGRLYTLGGSPDAFNTALWIERVVQVLVVVNVLGGALVRLYGDSYVGRRPDPLTAVRFATRRLAGLVWIGVLVAVAVILGVFALVIGAVYLEVALCVASAAYIIEGRRGFSALVRSHRLVRGRWWATFGALLTVWIIILVLTAVLSTIALAPTKGGNPVSATGYVVLQSLSLVIAYSIGAPLWAAVTATIYFDLRVRKEGFGLRQLGDDLGGPAVAEPAAAPVATAPGDDPFDSGWPPGR